MKKIDIRELIDGVINSDPLLGPLSKEKMLILVRRVLFEIRESISNVESGPVNFVGLGRFNVRLRSRQGIRSDGSSRIVTFRSNRQSVLSRAATVAGRESGAAQFSKIDEVLRIQISSATSYNRYAKVFSAVKAMHANGDPKKILSFGCSTGDEPLALSCLWFPESKIVGVDINPGCIIAARKKTEHLGGKVEIEPSDRSVLESHGPFDLIFAMSVLCAWPVSRDLHDISPYYSFNRFEENVGLLMDVLAVGGILILWNASFRLTDTRYAEYFQPVVVESIAESGFVKKFDCNNFALVDQDYRYFAFVRMV